MVPIGETVKDEVPLATLQHRPNSNVENHALKDNPSNGVSTPQPGVKGDLPLNKTEKMDKLRLGEGGKASPKQSGMEGSTLSSIREKKVSEDGYNWRKYGQKLVKGNEYVRSYYRCTHPNCLVKRQIERLHDGKVVDIVYLGQHDHPKPQLNIPVAVGFAVSIVEERRKDPSLATAKDTSTDEKSKPSLQTKPVNIRQVPNVVAEESTKQIVLSNKARIDVHTEEDPDSKRQKKDKDYPKTSGPDKPTNEPRVVIQTVSEVDIVNDGYRWRKYGQKLVKGNPNPRSYYRCSNSGCPMKKHVERASHDPKTVMTTYEGQHSHDMPQVRIVTHNAGDSTTKSQGNSASLDLVADAILEHGSELEEPNSKLACRPAPSDASVKKENNPVNKHIPVVKSEGNNACVVNSIKSEKKNPDSEPVRG